MLKTIVAVGMALSFSVGVWADYVADRQAALALVQSGKRVEALAAFTNMAAGAASDFQKSDALEQAAMCANSLKQPDLALELAKQIPIAAVSKQCRMRLLRGNWKIKELIDEFKTEDIERWPASENVIGYGLYYRGSAYYHLKDGPAAEADLKKALDYFADGNPKADILAMLGNNYRDNLKDNPQALAAYARIIEKIKWCYGYNTVLISAAGILREQGKYNEALELLGTVDLSKVKVAERCALLGAYGETLAGQGKRAEALAKFNEALGTAGISDAQKESCQKRIQALQADAK